jgi:hypothetical protein
MVEASQVGAGAARAGRQVLKGNFSALRAESTLDMHQR